MAQVPPWPEGSPSGEGARRSIVISQVVHRRAVIELAILMDTYEVDAGRIVEMLSPACSRGSVEGPCTSRANRARSSARQGFVGLRADPCIDGLVVPVRSG
jgi:hypothetical protein